MFANLFQLLGLMLRVESGLGRKGPSSVIKPPPIDEQLFFFCNNMRNSSFFFLKNPTQDHHLTLK